MNAGNILIASGCFFTENLPAFLGALADFSKRRNVKIQGFDAHKVVDCDHLLFSVHRAQDAFAKGTHQAKDLGLETLRFSSGQRKIDKAFSMGLSAGENRSFFIFFGDDAAALQKAETVFRADFQISDCPDLSLKEKKPFLTEQFGITEAELGVVGEERIKELVMERVALVDVTR